MQNKRYIKNFQHYNRPLEEKENSPAGFFPNKIKWEKNPAGFFIQKQYFQFLAQRIILHSVFKVVRVLYQNRGIPISPLVGNPKIYVTKMAMYHC